MASGMNPFDLLDGGAEDVKALVASQLEKTEREQKQKKQANSALKTRPPFQEVRRFKGGDSGGGRGYGRGGYNKGPASSGGSFNSGRGAGGASEGDAAKQYGRRKYEGPFHGGHHRGFSNGDGADRAERPPRKVSEQSFRLAKEAYPETEKLGAQNTVTEDAVSNGSKNNAVNNLVEEKPEHKEMTLEEYQKVLEEKKKALHALKVAERKVDIKEFQSMQPLSNKRTNNAVVSKLVSFL
uniref:Hyaluronan/mRNA-binding protein domain-containing protein n=1 Tax=Kalanchoe fedtschenkoi TaxID=63787 RepID=A0A7N0U6A8_KALFE